MSLLYHLLRQSVFRRSLGPCANFRTISTSLRKGDVHEIRSDIKLHWEELTKESKHQKVNSASESKKRMAAQEQTSEAGDETAQTKRPQFGNRFLENPDNVFQHNAWDNVTWDPEQLEAAKKKVEDNSREQVDPHKKESYEVEADRYWDDFYSQHQNKFFKDRHWLFTEFPELSSDNDAQSTLPYRTPGTESSIQGEGSFETAGAESSSRVNDESCNTKSDVLCNEGPEVGETACKNLAEEHLNHEIEATEAHLKCDSTSKRDVTSTSEEASSEVSALCDFPGKLASKRILEVGCGVGNTIFPILQTNADPSLFIYGCDFSSVAVEIVRGHAEYDSARCHGFVCDVSDPNATFPFPNNSLDIIVMIFVMSAINPDRFQLTINTLSRLLKPGGRFLFRDYGRYDLAQLRFKKGRCLSENFYVRGDGTRVYFFTQEELRTLFTSAGLTEEQNVIDRRLQVNRGRQLTMYRVWIQCKYRKPIDSALR